MRDSCKGLIPVVGVLALSLLPLYAQKTTGTIRGLVTDSTDAVITNATVSIRNEETTSTSTVNSNAQGEYVAPQLATGSYTITVEAPGFTPSKAIAVILHVFSTRSSTLRYWSAPLRSR